MIDQILDRIYCANWLIDLGPEGGDKGEEIADCGTPEQVAAHPTSHAGRFWPRRRRSFRPRPWQA